MGNNIQIGGLSEAIQKELTLYSKEITDGIKKAVDDVSEELLQNTDAENFGENKVQELVEKY